MTLLMNKPGSGVFDQDPGRISTDAPGERELRKLRDDTTDTLRKSA